MRTIARRVVPIGLCVTGIVAFLSAAPGAETRPGPRLSLRGLGDLPGGRFHSEALALSDNGQVVAGRSSSEFSEEEGFLWTRRDGLVPLLGPGPVHVAGEPRALTRSGHAIAGKIVAPGGPLEAAL